MKKILFTLPILILVLTMVTPAEAVFRDTTDPGASTGEPTTSSTPVPSASFPAKAGGKTIKVDTAKESARTDALTAFKAAKTDAIRLEKLKTVGQKAIDIRVAFLESLLTRISDKTIAGADKDSLSKEINIQITYLKALKVTITAETDLTKLKEEIKSIYNQHYIFALFAPKIRGLAAVAQLDTVLTRLTTAQTAAETYLAERKTAGVDVTTGELALTDLAIQIEAVKTAQTLAKTKFTAITLSNLSEGRALVKEGKTALQTAKTAISKAKADLKVISDLK